MPALQIDKNAVGRIKSCVEFEVAFLADGSGSVVGLPLISHTFSATMNIVSQIFHAYGIVSLQGVKKKGEAILGS